MLVDRLIKFFEAERTRNDMLDDKASNKNGYDLDLTVKEGSDHPLSLP